MKALHVRAWAAWLLRRGSYRGRWSFAVVLVCGGGPMLAQSQEATDLDTVSVTGIRGSLQSSMNLKRESIGVVDGIIAEDIGKFPDTNLAESLQRISGVSIDRTSSGEGSKVTVRGISPDLNMVLLNGRQMPASNMGSDGAGEGSGISDSRAFDFSNLASEAVSELEVYKTVHATMPTGGIGATLNIKTVRPLQRPGFQTQIGIKAVMDRSADNLPHTFSERSITPEISGIFSNTWLDDRLGMALTGSWQERDSGYSRVENIRGWYTFRGDDVESLFHLPKPGEPGYDQYEITNPPEGDDIYGRPLDMTYTVNGVQRTRRNGQMVLQFMPWDNLTLTADYTYAQNKVQKQGARMWASFAFLPGASTWTNGPVAGPIRYSERPVRDAAIVFGTGLPAYASELKSLGFNIGLKANDALDIAFDWHHLRASSLPDGPYGSNGFIGATATVRRNVEVDFSGELPILNFEMLPGVTQLEPEHGMLATSLFMGSFNWSEVKQGQASGTFRFVDWQALAGY